MVDRGLVEAPSQAATRHERVESARIRGVSPRSPVPPDLVELLVRGGPQRAVFRPPHDWRWGRFVGEFQPVLRRHYLCLRLADGENGVLRAPAGLPPRLAPQMIAHGELRGGRVNLRLPVPVELGHFSPRVLVSFLRPLPDRRLPMSSSSRSNTGFLWIPAGEQCQFALFLCHLRFYRAFLMGLAIPGLEPGFEP